MSCLQPIRGTRDISGDELLIHNAIIQKARKISLNYNFEEIATPIFEMSEVFHRTLGETSDIVSKETYTFQDRDGSYITLRPEFTAGIVRSAISNSLLQSMPRRYFSAGPVFRHERPQKCRYRQFHQLNFEIFGSSDYTADVECIMLACDILKSIGLQDAITLEISTLGDFQSRAAYREKLVEYFSRYKAELSEDSLVRLEKNPLRILDSKDEGDKKIVAGAPRIFDALNDESKARFDKVRNQLTKLNIHFIVNEKIVRGMDYYCHTVFEFTTKLLGS
jgi:histidyl-tRNA synthetase